jgi:hypothetical protein
MRFIEHLQNVTTNKDYAPTVLNTLQFTRAQTSFFSTCCVFAIIPLPLGSQIVPVPQLLHFSVNWLTNQLQTTTDRLSPVEI